ncbi:hypothetical protein ACOBQJ_09425 [Pelotomaculum propionicicum]|uniref:hypothetical protein n=1 Tax=Pelotomaculum propionicicum TaxID=258475 RepID=UPI003B7B810F
MSDTESMKKVDIRKILALIALAGASVMAYGAGNYLSYTGVTYYAICAAAVILNFNRAVLLLWAAVGVHAVLVGYGLWNWQSANIVPCIYCFGAAGFALLAASAYTRLAAAAAPVFLIAVTWYAWPYLFTDNGQAGVPQQTQTQTTEQQPENKPTADVNFDPAGEITKTDQDSQTVSAATQSEIPPEQTGVSDQAANPANQQGSTPASNDPGDKPADKPEDKPGNGTAEQPPAPDKPGSG